MLKDYIRSSPWAAIRGENQKERVDLPHIDIQIGDIAKIQDQVPSMDEQGTIQKKKMNKADKEDQCGLTSRPYKQIEPCAGYPRC
jgi:hypothetical protein